MKTMPIEPASFSVLSYLAIGSLVTFWVAAASLHPESIHYYRCGIGAVIYLAWVAFFWGRKRDHDWGKISAFGVLAVLGAVCLPGIVRPSIEWARFEWNIEQELTWAAVGATIWPFVFLAIYGRAPKIAEQTVKQLQKTVFRTPTSDEPYEVIEKGGKKFLKYTKPNETAPTVEPFDNPSDGPPSSR